MRVVLTHPYCWPWVRRGSERFIAELARYLAGRGHEVTTVSSRPGPRTVERTEGGRRILHHQWWWPPLGRVRIQPPHTFMLGCLQSLATLKADVVQSLTFPDAWAANLLRRVRGYRTVFQITGPIVPHHFPRVPPDRYLLRAAVRGADCRVTHSEFTARIVRAHYGVDAEVIPVPIDLDAFPVKPAPTAGPPVLLCVASFAEPRKGLRVLVRAFELIKRELPSAVLWLSGRMPEAVRREVIAPLPPAVRAGIETLGVGALADVPRLYREASLTLLPSMWEAYGMTVVESWASGTPVVVTDHGGLSELVTDAQLGRRFDPQGDGQETLNAAGLAEAILSALPLAADEQTPRRCRARAEGFAWSVLGPAYERLYVRS